MQELLPRTSYKRKAERLEVQLNAALRREEWAVRDAKVAKYDLGEAQKEIARLRAELKKVRGQASLPMEVA